MCYFFQLSDQASRWFSLRGHETAVSPRRTTRSQKVRSPAGKQEARQVNRQTEMGKIDTSVCFEEENLPSFKSNLEKEKWENFPLTKKTFFLLNQRRLSLFSAFLNADTAFLWRNLKKVFKGSILIHWPFSDWEKKTVPQQNKVSGSWISLRVSSQTAASEERTWFTPQIKESFSSSVGPFWKHFHLIMRYHYHPLTFEEGRRPVNVILLL